MPQNHFSSWFTCWQSQQVGQGLKRLCKFSSCPRLRTDKIACEYPVRNTKSLQRRSQRNATTASAWGCGITSNAAIQGGGGIKGRKIPPKRPRRGSFEVKEMRQGGNGSLDQGFQTLAGPAQESRLQSCQSDWTSLAFPALTIKIQSPSLSAFSSRCQI